MEDNNCFARRGRVCIILTLGKCYGRCGFYKTEEEYEQGHLAALRRIAGLPEYIQNIISDNYYLGMSPWNSVEQTGGAL